MPFNTSFAINSIFHAPHEGERLFLHCVSSLHFIQYSTLPTRGSDAKHSADAPPTNAQYSTLPTRGSDGKRPSLIALITLNIPRSPRGGATFSATRNDILAYPQYSTLPTRGSDNQARLDDSKRSSSIFHAPHEGERRVSLLYASSDTVQYSTLPTRGSD